jgi:hypothetical protein
LRGGKYKGTTRRAFFFAGVSLGATSCSHRKPNAGLTGSQIMTAGRRFVAFIAGVLALIACSASSANAQFAGLAGTWTGGGKIAFSDGTSDRLRCRATYSVGGGGSQVTLTLRCASDSYNFNLTGSLAASGGSVQGTWTESTRGIGGTLSGTATASSVRLQVIGPAFAAGLSMTVSGNRQVVQIAAPASSIQSAIITLSKGG